MAKLHLKFNKGDGTVWDTPKAWIVLGDHGINYGGLEHHLSATCVNAKEVEEAAQYLAKQLDEIVTKAQRKFSKQPTTKKNLGSDAV